VERYKLGRYKSERCTIECSNWNLERTTERVRNKFLQVRRSFALAPNKFLSERRMCQLLEPPSVTKNLLSTALTGMSELVRQYVTQNQLPMVPTELSELVQKMLVQRHEPQNQLPCRNRNRKFKIHFDILCEGETLKIVFCM